MTSNQITTQTTTAEITESSEIWRVGIDWNKDKSLRVDVFARQRVIVNGSIFEGESEQITAQAPSIEAAIANTAQMFANHPVVALREKWGQEYVEQFIADLAEYCAAVHTMGKLAQQAEEPTEADFPLY